MRANLAKEPHANPADQKPALILRAQRVSFWGPFPANLSLRAPVVRTTQTVCGPDFGPKECPKEWRKECAQLAGQLASGRTLAAGRPAPSGRAAAPTNWGPEVAPLMPQRDGGARPAR